MSTWQSLREEIMVNLFGVPEGLTDVLIRLIRGLGYVGSLNDSEIGYISKELMSYASKLGMSFETYLSLIAGPHTVEFFSVFGNDLFAMMVAVTRNGQNLRYASEYLRDDSDLVELAVSHDGMAVRWGSRRVRNLPRVVRKALRNNPQAKQFLATYS